MQYRPTSSKYIYQYNDIPAMVYGIQNDVPLVIDTDVLVVIDIDVLLGNN